MELNIHAKKSQGTKHFVPELKIITTTHEKFKVVKLEVIEQSGYEIKVNVYLDEKQSVKKVAEYAFSHPKHKKTA